MEQVFGVGSPEHEPKIYEENIWVTSLRGRMPTPETFAKRIGVKSQNVHVFQKIDLHQKYEDTLDLLLGQKVNSLGALQEVLSVQFYAENLLRNKKNEVAGIPFSIQFQPVGRQLGIAREGHLDSYKQIKKFLNKNKILQKPMVEHEQTVKKLLNQTENIFPKDLTQILFVFVR